MDKKKRRTNLGHRGNEALVSGPVSGAPPGLGAAPLPRVVLAAPLATRLRHAVRAGPSAPAVGALEEAEGGLDAPLGVAEVPAALAEAAALRLALRRRGA